MSRSHPAAGPYARALLQLAQAEGQLAEVQADLDLAEQLFGAGQGRDLLVHPLVSPEQKQAAVQRLLADQVGPLTLSLLRLLIEKRRGGLIGEIAAAYREERERLQRTRTATVSSATPLSESQLGTLRAKLAELAGGAVELEQVTDPALRGGARITLGDLVVDGTLEARLNQLRRALGREQAGEN